MKLPSALKLPILLALLLGIFVVVVNACAADTMTAPLNDLPCSNVVTPPERYTVPRRYADTVIVLGNQPGTSLYGKPVALAIFGSPAEQKCLTLTDSLYIERYWRHPSSGGGN